MAVEEKVRENIPQAEGEVQGVRYISLTEEELDRLMKAAGREGAKKGVEAYERRKEKGICGDIKQIPEVYGHQKRRSSYPFNDRECQRENGCSWV